MKIKVNRDNEEMEASKVTIKLNGSKYSITESVEGGLNINKCGLDDDGITIKPRVSNVIIVR
jgi:hypothetical protein